MNHWYEADLRSGVRLVAGIDPQQPVGWTFFAYESSARLASGWAANAEDAKRKAEAWAIEWLKLKLDEPLQWRRLADRPF